jgi:hypothetical protein
VEYHHLHSGQCDAGGRQGARLQVQIEASCQTFGDIWTSV